MKRIARSQNGLTLVEMIIAILIMALFLGTVTVSIMQGLKLYQKESTSVSLEDQLRSVEDVMIRDLRPCAWVGVTYTPTRLNFSRTATANYDQYYEYNAVSKVLYRKLEGGNNDPIASDIISFVPSTLSITPSVLYVEIAISSERQNTTKSATFSVTIRNYR